MSEPLIYRNDLIRCDMMKEAGLIGHSGAVKDPNNRKIENTTDPSVLHRLEPIVRVVRTLFKVGSLIVMLCHASRYSFICAVIIVGVRLCFSAHMRIGSLLSGLLPARFRFPRRPDYDPHRDEVQRIQQEVESNKEELRIFGLADQMLESWEDARKKLHRQTSLPLITICGHAQLELLLYVGLHVSYRLFARRSHKQHVVLRSIADSVFSFQEVRMHQRALDRLVNSLSVMMTELNAARQVIYCLGAFLAISQWHETRNKGGKAYTEDIEEWRGMRIKAEDVTIFDPLKKQTAVKNLDLEIKPGQMLAIIGNDAIAKTNLAMGLMGFRSYTGTILINGQRLEDIKSAQLMAHMSGMFTNPTRYHARTMSYNVHMGDVEGNGIQALETALKLSTLDRELHGRIPATQKRLLPGVPFPDLDQKVCRETRQDARLRRRDVGRECTCNDQHLLLEQWRRVAFARSLMRVGSAKLMMFDQPTLLNTTDEDAIVQCIYRLTQKHNFPATTIYIAAWKNTVYRADIIAHVVDGVSQSRTVWCPIKLTSSTKTVQVGTRPELWEENRLKYFVSPPWVSSPTLQNPASRVRSYLDAFRSITNGTEEEWKPDNMLKELKAKDEENTRLFKRKQIAIEAAKEARRRAGKRATSEGGDTSMTTGNTSASTIEASHPLQWPPSRDNTIQASRTGNHASRRPTTSATQESMDIHERNEVLFPFQTAGDIDDIGQGGAARPRAKVSRHHRDGFRTAGWPRGRGAGANTGPRFRSRSSRREIGPDHSSLGDEVGGESNRGVEIQGGGERGRKAPRWHGGAAKTENETGRNAEEDPSSSDDDSKAIVEGWDVELPWGDGYGGTGGEV